MCVCECECVFKEVCEGGCWRVRVRERAGVHQLVRLAEAAPR